MFSNPESFICRAIFRVRIGVIAGCAAAILAGCGTTQNHAPTPAMSANPMEALAADCANAPVVQPIEIIRLNTPFVTEAVVSMLAYAQQVRGMPAAELNQEVSRLGNGAGAAEQLKLSLVLRQFAQLPELIRAQELLARVLLDTGAQAQALHPLARLLQSQDVDRRRLEELLEKQTQQTHEVQHKLDQTLERLNALKAIERSLTNRSSADKSTPPKTRGTAAPMP